MKLPAPAFLVACLSLVPVQEGQGHGIEYVDGRACLRCQISSRDKRIDAHLILDLGMPGALVLDRNACSLLEVQPKDLLTLDLSGTGRLESLPFRGADLSSLWSWTAEKSQALSEIPVWGIVGLKAFQGSSVWLDLQARKLEYGSLAMSTQTWHRLDTTRTPAGRIRLEIEPYPNYRLPAAFNPAIRDSHQRGLCGRGQGPGRRFRTLSPGAFGFVPVHSHSSRGGTWAASC